MSIEWKGPTTSKERKARIKSIGTMTAMGQTIEWFVTKSLGNMSYGLHLGEVKKHPMMSQATITECKQYAERYF